MSQRGQKNSRSGSTGGLRQLVHWQSQALQTDYFNEGTTTKNKKWVY